MYNIAAMLNFHKTLKVKELEVIDSTNDEAKRLSKIDNNNYLITSDIQTKGRGRSGKEWISNSGNLYFSLLLKENYQLSYLNAFPSIISLAIAKTLKECGLDEEKIQLKWPNDVLVNSKKIAGILLESKINPINNNLDYLIIGCGINIVSFPELSNYKATSLYDEQKKNINKRKILELFLESFHNYLKIFEQESFTKIITLWRLKEWGVDRKISLTLKNKEIKGIYRGINLEGNAEVETEEKTLLTISSGEIFFN